MKKLTTDEYIQRAKEKHGDTYLYSKTKYINSVTKVIITCPIHGDWEANAGNHISKKAGKCGCPKCVGKGLSTNEWIIKFNNIHNNKFDYSKFIYKSIYEKSTIICYKHGEFEQNPHNHAQGQQCPECSKEETWVNNSFYNINNAERNKLEWLIIPCNLYVIKMISNLETFYKIGITKQELSRRFREHDTPYKIELIENISTNRYEAILMENKLHNIHKEYQYKPQYLFKGHTECFSQFKGFDNA